LDIHILTNCYQRIDPWNGRAQRLPVELDLGCGKGGFLLDVAARHPDRLVVGADVMLGRLRKVAAKAEQRQLHNVELWRASSLELLGHQLPDNCITRLHVLCPDPWPKARHRWRRLVTTDFLQRAARVTVRGGVIHVATDEDAYFESILEAGAKLACLRREPDLEALADIADLTTDFEKQWIAAGKTVPHVIFRVQ
jgi:tRNA (guanine-N7-)-methyltransferase